MAKTSKSLKKNAPAKPASPKRASLKTGSSDKIEICEIRNLTQSTLVTYTENATTPLSPADRFSSKIKGKLDALPSVPEPSDSIQIIWGVKKGDTFTTKYRGVGGTLVYDVSSKEVTISGLKNVSKLSLGVKGVLEIGPSAPPEGEAKPAVAHLSINMGNLNKERDWIINLSDKENGDDGSYIKLKALIDWVKEKVPDSDGSVELPATGDGKDPKEFTILFNDFYLNLTRKTFRFDVESKAGEEITFGSFTIKKAGFIVTNEPYLAAEDESDQDEEEEQDEEQDEE